MNELHESEMTTGMVPEDRLSESDYLKMVMPMTVAAETYNQLQEFYKRHLVEGRDYGRVPGIDRPFLHQPGAQNLGMVYGLRPRFRITDRSDMSLVPPFIDYDVCCELLSQKSGVVRGEGVGNCNSWESKYRYRYRKPVCPHCGEEAVIKGKAEYGGGWLCHKKQGGCGRKWKDGDEAIEGQPLGKTENIDVADQKNTILKMAKKRAYVDAMLTTTAASGIFTQDPEDVGGMSPEDHASSPSAKTAADMPTLSGSIKKTIGAFGRLGINQETIEEYFDRPADEWDEGHIDVLRVKYQSIKNGEYAADKAFAFQEPEAIPVDDIPEPDPSVAPPDDTTPEEDARIDAAEAAEILRLEAEEEKPKKGAKK